MQEDRQQLSQLIRAAVAHLEAEQELGVERLSVPIVKPAPVPDASPRAAPGAPAAPAPAPAQPEGAPRPPGDKRRRLEQLALEAAACTACVLHEKRTKNVFARGNPDAELVFVGEGPGRDEDLAGLPFVGPAGKLLDRMVVAMGYARDDVYICNIVKCRPPENRTPRAEEAIACSRFLAPQIELVAPRVIVALGRCAAQNLHVAEATGPWRGRWGSYAGIPVMPTYHPAFLLRSPEFKRTVWQDLQLVMARLGKQPPPRRPQREGQ